MGLMEHNENRDKNGEPATIVMLLNVDLLFIYSNLSRQILPTCGMWVALVWTKKLQSEHAFFTLLFIKEF